MGFGSSGFGFSGGGGGGGGGALTQDDKNLPASVTVADFDTTGVAITTEPSGDGYVIVAVNGVSQVLGDGVRTDDCYFSDDAGATAKAISDITDGDILYWVGSVAGYELAITDIIDLNYQV